MVYFTNHLCPIIEATWASDNYIGQHRYKISIHHYRKFYGIKFEIEFGNIEMEYLLEAIGFIIL